MRYRGFGHTERQHGRFGTKVAKDIEYFVADAERLLREKGCRAAADPVFRAEIRYGEYIAHRAGGPMASPRHVARMIGVSRRLNALRDALVACMSR